MGSPFKTALRSMIVVLDVINVRDAKPLVNSVYYVFVISSLPRAYFQFLHFSPTRFL